MPRSHTRVFPPSLARLSIWTTKDNIGFIPERSITSQKVAKQTNPLYTVLRSRERPVSAPGTHRVIFISCPRPAQAEITDDMQLFKLMLLHLTFFLDVTQCCDFMREELKDPMTQCPGTPRFQESWNGEGGSVAHVEKVWLRYMNLRCLVSCAPLIVEGKGFVS